MSIKSAKNFKTEGLCSNDNSCYHYLKLQSIIRSDKVGRLQVGSLTNRVSARNGFLRCWTGRATGNDVLVMSSEEINGITMLVNNKCCQ